MSILYYVDPEQPPGSWDPLLMRAVGAALERHYPGHAWTITMDTRGGMMTVWNFDVSAHYGVFLKLDGNLASPAFLGTHVMRLVGEFLERFDLRRGRADPDQLMALSLSADYALPDGA